MDCETSITNECQKAPKQNIKQLIKPYQCTLCQVKHFKSIRGLSRHESLVHSNYKLPPSNLPYLPPDAIQKFREMLVFLIKKRLSLHFRKTGKQTIKVPCSESQFVGVFGPWIQCYSPCKRKYTCFFKGQNANKMLSVILQDTEWGG